MSTFRNVLTLLVTVVFIVGPLWLTLSIIYRYLRLERAVDNYTAMLRAVMAYLERRQRPEPPVPMPENEQPQNTMRPLAKLLALFRRRTLSPNWLSDLKLRDEYEDYLAIIRLYGDLGYGVGLFLLTSHLFAGRYS